MFGTISQCNTNTLDIYEAYFSVMETPMFEAHNTCDVTNPFVYIKDLFASCIVGSHPTRVYALLLQRIKATKVFIKIC